MEQIKKGKCNYETQMEEDQAKEIEWLRKEKEWLIEQYIYSMSCMMTPYNPPYYECDNDEEKKELVLKEMQQALKEKDSEVLRGEG